MTNPMAAALRANLQNLTHTTASFGPREGRGETDGIAIVTNPEGKTSMAPPLLSGRGQGEGAAVKCKAG
jgi:hypothetical protein